VHQGISYFTVICRHQGSCCLQRSHWKRQKLN